MSISVGGKIIFRIKYVMPHFRFGIFLLFSVTTSESLVLTKFETVKFGFVLLNVLIILPLSMFYFENLISFFIYGCLLDCSLLSLSVSRLSVWLSEFYHQLY